VAGRLANLRRLVDRRRIAGAVLVAAVLAALAFQLLARDSAAAPRVTLPPATATIGEGTDAVPVGPDGAILEWLPLSEEVQLPSLPISEPPPKGELGGEVLEQARVLGAAPAALRPYIESSYYGESGVDVELRSGIELRFGNATRLKEKWKAAVAVLADPEIVALDYVDLHEPRRPAVAGSGHALPPVP
jgi:hypothetical protein